MKTTQLSLLVLLFRAGHLEAKSYRKNVSTFEVGTGAVITGNKIEYNEPDCDPGLSCIISRSCGAKGTVPVLTADKKFFACCAEGQRILGSPETAFDCCAAGHDITGNSTIGYHCCETGLAWDGTLCKEVCRNGKVLLDGKCACPKGQVEGADGKCKTKPKCRSDEEETPDGECRAVKPDTPQCRSDQERGPDGQCRTKSDGQCRSGLETGRCYMFKAENGNRLGLRKDNVYYAAPDSMTQRYGKFQLCADMNCTAGLPVVPSKKVFIRDTYGDLATGANRGQWLNAARNGAHIARTPSFNLAGNFSISKWPCGRYCLGGFTEGVGPACPAEIPAMTFYSQDPQMCVAFEFIEVPCDIKNDANSCIWKSGDQCCNKIDCGSKKSE